MTIQPIDIPRRQPSRPTYKGVVAIGLLLAVSAYAALPTPRAEAATTFQALTHNIRRINDDEVRYITAVARPLVVSVQEVCEPIYNNLAWHMGTYGYATVVYAAQRNIVACYGDIFVVHGTRGEFTRGSADVIIHAYPPHMQADNDPARRGFVCVRAGIYYTSWWGCSTHITPSDSYYAAAQSNHMRSTAMYLNDRAVIVGGDFNLTLFHASMPEWQRAFHEGDERQNDPTFGANKIDYIWSIKYRTSAAFGDADVGCGGRSDHCYILSTHQFLP